MIKKIAILGTRGIPANYGGFETFAEELSTRLTATGYDMTVYCRKGNSPYPDRVYKGVHLVTLPTIKHKYFDTIANTFLSAWHVSFSSIEIVYICNAINSIFAIIPRVFGKKVIINVDGLEWKRAKWNLLGKFAYQASERIATIFANVIISDSKVIEQYYKDRYKRDTCFIPYGASKRKISNSEEIIKKYGLQSKQYFLYVSRLEPENNAHIIIKAFEKLNTNFPLVIVGSAPYGKPYIENLRATKDQRIEFFGAIYGEDYYALQSHAYVYIHGNEVGGTNPALLEAMTYGNCAVVNGVRFNKEVIGDVGVWFEPNNIDDLKEKFEFLLHNPDKVEQYRKLAPKRIEEFYNWDDVVFKYEKLFQTI